MTSPPLDLLAALLAALKPPPVPDASLHDLLTTQARLMEEQHRTRRLLVDASRPAPEEGDEGLGALLLEAQRALLMHPIAAQAIFSGLVAEGRRYAETEDGAALLAGLRASPTFARASDAWVTLAGGVVRADPDVVLSSSWVEEIVAVSSALDVVDLYARFQART